MLALNCTRLQRLTSISGEFAWACKTRNAFCRKFVTLPTVQRHRRDHAQISSSCWDLCLHSYISSAMYLVFPFSWSRGGKKRNMFSPLKKQTRKRRGKKRSHCYVQYLFLTSNGFCGDNRCNHETGLFTWPEVADDAWSPDAVWRVRDCHTTSDRHCVWIWFLFWILSSYLRVCIMIVIFRYFRKIIRCHTTIKMHCFSAKSFPFKKLLELHQKKMRCGKYFRRWDTEHGSHACFPTSATACLLNKNGPLDISQMWWKCRS